MWNDVASGVASGLASAISPALEWVKREPALALVLATAAYLLLFALALANLVRSRTLAKRQARLWNGTDGASLERMLQEQMDSAQTVRREIERAGSLGDANASALRDCLQKVGLIRYDAFADVGGEQSFSLALLDQSDNGLVISSLFSRHSMRVYAKPIVSGASTVALTDEERQAIAASRVGGGGGMRDDVKAARRGS